MRFVPRNCIKPNTELAKPILGTNGEVLLEKGVKMKRGYIRRLEMLGIPGAYINDSISENIVIASALSDELRAQAVHRISHFFSKAGSGQKLTRGEAAKLRQTAENIVEEIIHQGDVMLNLIDLKVYDSYTFYHCVNVTVLAVLMGIGLDYPRNRLMRLAYAALLHDVGKVFVPPLVINKPSALTTKEFEEVKTHSQAGHDYLKDHFPETVSIPVLMAVLDHHERIDGTGYPNAKSGEDISEFARIIAVADVYDALTSDRPYRKGMFAANAIEYIQGNVGTLFAFEIVNIFSRKVALFPVGTCVMLSNGATGLVLENYEGLTQRPLLHIFEEDGIVVEPYRLDLSQERFDLTIVSTVDM